MYPKLLHLYGSFYINSFGLCLAIGLAVFIYFLSADSAVKKMFSKDEVINLTIYSAIIGVISGRILYILTEFTSYDNLLDLINFSSGGSSVMGSVVGAMTYLVVVSRIKGLPILKILDAAGIYAPIIHSISRIGCFLSGCCYGCQTAVPWGIVYTNPDTVAPLYMTIHPTQLYSALVFLLMFVFMYFTFGKEKSKVPGLAFGVYLMLSSIERIFVDFIRGDRIFLLKEYEVFKILSLHQVIALGMLFSASIYLVIVFIKKNTVKA